jgi:hypothetical protein
VNLAKQSERSYSQKSNLRSEANWFILKLYNIEGKRTGSIVILYLKQQQKSEDKAKYSFLNYRRNEDEAKYSSSTIDDLPLLYDRIFCMLFGFTRACFTKMKSLHNRMLFISNRGRPPPTHAPPPPPEHWFKKGVKKCKQRILAAPRFL